MARELMNISCVPAEEECQGVGTPTYDPVMARKECEAFRNQLRRMFGEPPGSARLVIKSFPHDFGSYSEVCVSYDDQSEEETDYAFKLEAEMPGKWDDEARKELGLVAK